MATETADDPILKRFRAAVAQIYGDRLARVVLFGSRARGDAGPDSDYDVAVFLRDMPDRWAELDRLAKLRVDLIDETALSSTQCLIRPRPIGNARPSCTKSGGKVLTYDAGSEPLSR